MLRIVKVVFIGIGLMSLLACTHTQTMSNQEVGRDDGADLREYRLGNQYGEGKPGTPGTSATIAGSLGGRYYGTQIGFGKP